MISSLQFIITEKNAMKHPVLARMLSVMLAVVCLIMLIAGVTGREEAEESFAEARREHEKLLGRIETYRSLEAALEGETPYSEANAEYIRALTDEQFHEIALPYILEGANGAQTDTRQRAAAPVAEIFALGCVVLQRIEGLARQFKDDGGPAGELPGGDELQCAFGVRTEALLQFEQHFLQGQADGQTVAVFKAETGKKSVDLFGYVVDIFVAQRIAQGFWH